MKKALLALLLLSIGTLISCTKEVKTLPIAAVTEHNTSAFIKDIGTAD